MLRSVFRISLILAAISMASCQKSSTTASTSRGDVGGGETSSEGEIEYEVSGTIAEEEPVDFVESLASVEIGGVNLTASSRYKITASYLNKFGKKIVVYEGSSSSEGARFNFKSKVPKNFIIVEALRLRDGGKFAGLLPPPMRKLLAKLRMNRTTSIAAKMAGIIGDKASSGGAAAQAALTTNSISVADVLMVAQSVRLAVDEQKNQNVGSSIDLNGPALKLLEKSNERLSALIAEGQKPEAVAEKLAEKTYATVFGDKAEETSPAILAHRTNHGLGSSAAATTDVAYETIKSLSTPAAKQLDEAFRVEAEAYRKAADLPSAVAAESMVSSVYAQKFTACKNGEPSCAAAAYVPPIPPVFLLGRVSAPIATPQAGIYTSGQAVTLSTSTPGATIYYTVDGSTPTTASTLYSNQIAILVDQTIKAIAVKNGYSTSSESSHVYSITGTVATPTFSIPQGSYGPTQSVSITTATPGAAIYFTIDGTTPSDGSTPYLAPITVSTSQTIRAIAILTNWNTSAEASAAYTINGSAAAPAFSVPEGSYGPAQTVSITTTTPGATIHYTTNGTDPTTSSEVYSNTVTVSSTTTIKAIAVMPGYSNSTISSATYTINGFVSAPTTNVPVGAYGPSQFVTLSSDTTGASILYTTGDGSQADPTCSSGSTSMPISVTATATIKAIACKTGYSDSIVLSFAYTINGTVADPTTNVPVGAYGPPQSVTLSSATSDASIRYTTGDGSQADPTCSSGITSMPIPVTVTSTIKAIACKPDYSESNVVLFAYTINGAVLPPNASPSGGTFTSAQLVTLTSSTPGSSIYYTLDGSEPTTSSTEYSSAISISSSTTLKAIASKTDYINSSVETYQYTVTSPEPIYKHSFVKNIASGNVQSLTIVNTEGNQISVGDTLVAVLMSRSDVTSVSPGSWTTLGSSSGIQRSGYRQRVTIAYKTATGDPGVDSQVIVTQTSSVRMIANVLVFKGGVIPFDLQSGANASNCAQAPIPASGGVLAEELLIYGYSNVFTPTWNGVEQVVTANFVDSGGAEDLRLVKDTSELFNRFTLAIGQMGIDHAIVGASTSSCYQDDSPAAEALRFKVKKQL